MKTSIENLFVLLALIAGLGLVSAARATAQTYTNLHSFNGTTDGNAPYAGLVLSGNTLYGTTYYPGYMSAGGTVFKVKTDGTGFTNLYIFTALLGGFQTNSDGANPYAGLILSSNILFGTTYHGGIYGNGTVFRINTDGTGFTNLYNFSMMDGFRHNNDGANPQGGLVLSGNTLYGTANDGGSQGGGTIFAINTDGTGFTTLHTFSLNSNGTYLKSDGSFPEAGLILSGNTLYGTANEGGSSLYYGTVFKINTDGSGYTTLHSFTATSGPYYTINSDGANPAAGLILSGNTLFGTAAFGGSSGNGTVFAVNTDGSSFTNMHSFTQTDNSGRNTDGGEPQAGLILSDNILYGTAYHLGSLGSGTVFAINTNGTDFTTLYTLNGPSDGAGLMAGLVLSGNILYGTASGGGNYSLGTVFSLSLGSVTVSAPQLTILHSGANLILTWPTNATGFTLQSTTNLAPPAVWTTNFPAPVVITGQNTVTNPITGSQKFYRLSQ